MKLFNLKLSCIVLILVTVGVCGVSFSSEELVQPCKPAPGKKSVSFLNAIVSLEQDDWNNAITRDISDALARKVPVICKASLLHQLIMHEVFSEEISKFPIQVHVLFHPLPWSVFLSADNNLAILLPCPFSDSLLQEFGFTPLQHIPPAEVLERFKDPAFAQRVDPQKLVDSFGKLFDVSKIIPKRFYLTGHGGTGITIAGIPLSLTLSSGRKVSPYMQLLKIFNDIGAEFVYVDTCYAGGPNLVRLQNEVILDQNKMLKEVTPGEIFSAAKIKYILIVQATTDEVTFGPKRLSLVFRDFFIELNKFFKNPRFFLGKKGIARVLELLYRDNPRILRLPSVRFPGTNSFFRAAHVAEMKIITWFDIKKLRTQHIFVEYISRIRGRRIAEETIKTEVKTKEIEARKAMPPPRPEVVARLREAASHAVVAPPIAKDLSIIVTPDIRYVLVYPCDMHDIMLDVQFIEGGRFISKIPGAAQHYIGAMKLHLPLAEAKFKLSKMFLHYFAISQEKGETIYAFGESPKAWFIKSISSHDPSGDIKRIENVVIYKYASPRGESSPDPFGEILFKEANIFYAVDGKNISERKEISEEEYRTRILDIYLATRAAPASLKEATGGGEDSTTEQKAFAAFIGYPLEKIIKQVAQDATRTGPMQKKGLERFKLLVQRDFGDLENKEEAYRLAVIAAKNAVLSRDVIRADIIMAGIALFEELFAKGKGYSDGVDAARHALLSENITLQMNGIRLAGKLVQRDFGDLKNKAEAYRQIAEAAQQARDRSSSTIVITRAGKLLEEIKQKEK